MKHILFVSVLLGIILPVLAFSQTPVSAPENPQEVKELGEKALGVAEKEGPGILGRIWQNDVWPIWKKLFGWPEKHIWEARFKPWLRNMRESALRILGMEVEKRKPGIETEFQQEKKEIRQEAPKLSKSLWQKFVEIIR